MCSLTPIFVTPFTAGVAICLLKSHLRQTVAACAEVRCVKTSILVAPEHGRPITNVQSNLLASLVQTSRLNLIVILDAN